MASPYYPAGSGVKDPYQARDFWQFCVAKGVQSIKRGLAHHHVPKPGGGGWNVNDGYMYEVTVEGVRAFQQGAGLVVDGQFGPRSGKAMFLPWLRQVWTSRSAEVPFALVAADLDLESGFDPGAQGDSSPADLGLEQKNTASYAVGWDLPFNPDWAFVDLVDELDAAWRTYSLDGSEVKSFQTEDLRRKCTVGHHFAPRWANDWWRTGIAPLPSPYQDARDVPPEVVTIEKYASATLSRAAKY